MLSSRLLASLLLLATVAVSGCAHDFRASDWRADITLPASEDCWGINVMSGKETRRSADDPVCIREKQTSIRLTSENYKILRKDIQKNCQLSQCKQITGAFDELFLTLDAALQKIPAP